LDNTAAVPTTVTATNREKPFYGKIREQNPSRTGKVTPTACWLQPNYKQALLSRTVFHSHISVSQVLFHSLSAEY